MRTEAGVTRQDSPEHYIQTCERREAGFDLEYRDGSAERHFLAKVADEATVAAAIWSWVTQTDAWRGVGEWEQISV